MATDIMADNQTESVLSLLDRGEADPKVQQAVSAALLRSQTKIIEELQEIKGNLWKPDDLKRYIDERHFIHCASCPAKKLAEDHSKLKKSFWSMAVSPTFMLFVLAALALLVAAYATIGKTGLETVTSSLPGVVSGSGK